MIGLRGSGISDSIPQGYTVERVEVSDLNLICTVSVVAGVQFWQVAGATRLLLPRARAAYCRVACYSLNVGKRKDRPRN